MEKAKNLKFSQSVAASCRYGDIASRIWGDWDLIWEDSEENWQGHASFIVSKGAEFCFYEWHYGSCSGCDGWEADGKGSDEVEAEMRHTAMWFKNKKQLRKWLDMLEGNPLSNYTMERGGGLAAGIDILSGGLLGRINAIRGVFGMPPYEAKKEEEE